MGFLDDLKKGADNLSESINSTVKGTQDKHQASSLLHDLGVLTWKSRTGQTGPDDDTERARIERELADLIAAGTTIELALKSAAPPPPPPPAAPSPPPPPAGEAPAPPAPPDPPAPPPAAPPPPT
jgi:hypothetical protein